MGLLPPDTSERIAAVFAPAELTHAVALELVEAAAEKGLWLDSAIDSAVPPRTRGDAAGIRRVLRALADHAVKTTARGHVALSLAAEPAEAGCCMLVFTVTDTGPVLVPDERRPLIAPAGGRIGCDEHHEGGNRVWFAVLVEAVEPTASCSAEQPETRLERLGTWARSYGGRILVVDDSAINRVITAALLSKAGFAVTQAEGGAEAVRMAADAEPPFDAVLMDVAMPEVDGLAATAAIRALPEPRGRVPIVAMTAHAFPEDRARCLAAGMDDYLAKPFRKLDLLEALVRRLVG